MASMKKVVILLSTYNGARYLPAFLESLVAQEFTDFDVLVRDDCSSDDTISTLMDFSERLSIRFLSADVNIGPAKSFMELLVAAGDGYDCYMFADQDDWWNVDKISRCIGLLDASDASMGPSLYCSTLELVDESLGHLGYTRVPSFLGAESALVENVATGCTVGVNGNARKIILSALPDGYTMHDWWVYLVITFFGRVYFDPVPCLKYRQHGANAVGATSSIIEEYKKRLRRFLKGSQTGVWSKSRQADAFLKCFGSELNWRQRRLVSLLCESQKGVGRSLYLLFFSPFKRQRKIDGIFLRLLFLIGRY